MSGFSFLDLDLEILVSGFGLDLWILGSGFGYQDLDV